MKKRGMRLMKLMAPKRTVTWCAVVTNNGDVEVLFVPSNYVHTVACLSTGTPHNGAHCVISQT